MGTGTGVIPRGMAQYGANIIATDISHNQINEAIELSKGMENIKYIGKRNLSCNDGDGNCQKRRRRIIYGFYNLFLHFIWAMLHRKAFWVI